MKKYYLYKIIDNSGSVHLKLTDIDYEENYTAMLMDEFPYLYENFIDMCEEDGVIDMDNDEVLFYYDIDYTVEEFDNDKDVFGYYFKSDSCDEYEIISDKYYENAQDLMKEEGLDDYDGWISDGYKHDEIPYNDFKILKLE